MLHKISSEYPTYVCQSTLSLAFAEVNSIRLQIDMSEYKEEFKKALEDEKEFNKFPPDNISLDAGLVTG